MIVQLVLIDRHRQDARGTSYIASMQWTISWKSALAVAQHMF